MRTAITQLRLVNSNLSAGIEALSATLDKQEIEIDRLKSDNEQLRTLLQEVIDDTSDTSMYRINSLLHDEITGTLQKTQQRFS